MASFCGYVAVLGRANAGKSTLVNALVGQKIVGVSRKPQTTRNKILAIATFGDAQMLLLDTPGLHRTTGQGQMNRLMHKESMGSLADAHAAVFLIDSKEGMTDEDLKIFEQVQKTSSAPLILALSKTDKIHKSIVRDRIEQVQRALCGTAVAQITSVTAKRQASLEDFRDLIKGYLPEAPFMFPEDDLTDRSTNFVMSELIREAIFRSVGEEIPYQTAVVISEYTREGDHALVRAEIIVARNSQKGIMIGKGGAKIKELGSLARLNIEQFLDCKVFLDLQVKVQDHWVDSAVEISHLMEIQL